jgi:L-iditol 2-dehydrogenase
MMNVIARLEKIKMHAAVFHAPNNIAIEEVYYNHDDHRLRGVSLRVNACAVCGYDARVFRNGHQKVTPPIILGHEICGRIESDVVVTNTATDLIGQTVLEAGSRVAVSPIIPCLDCKFCHSKQYNLCFNLKEIGSSIHGGFAQYVRVPEKIIKIGGLVPVPNNLSDDEATLLEPLACCLNGFSQLGQITREDTTVAIIGDGPIGLLHLQISKRLFGAKTIVIGKIPHRMHRAKVIGADEAVRLNGNDNSSACSDEEALENILDCTDGVGANVVIVATSNPAAIGFAQKIASKDSRINLFAGIPQESKLSLDTNWLHYNQIKVTGSFSSVPNTLQQAVRLASNGDINLSEIISHRYSLVDIKEAFLATEEYRGLRVVIDDFR